MPASLLPIYVIGHLAFAKIIQRSEISKENQNFLPILHIAKLLATKHISDRRWAQKNPKRL